MFNLFKVGFLIGFIPICLNGQTDTISLKSISEINLLVSPYHKNKSYKKADSLCKQYLPFVKKTYGTKKNDSVANFYYYLASTNQKLETYQNALEYADLGLAHIKDAEELKGVLYYTKAFVQDKLNLKESELSYERAADVLSAMKKPNINYLIGAYSALAKDRAYKGDMESAKRYFRHGEKVFNKRQEDVNENSNFYDISNSRASFLYDKIYLLTYSKDSKRDSVLILNTLADLSSLHRKSNYADNQKIYYVTSLALVGDWLISSEEKNTSKKNKRLQLGLELINKSLDLTINNGYPGQYFQIAYNKCKALNYANYLTEANTLINHLLDSIPVKDYRIPFFYAQKGLINAKLKKKDTALNNFYLAVKSCNLLNEDLSKDYKNYKPTEVYNETKLLLRIGEKINQYFSSDAKTQEILSNIYYASFLQFENSYASRKVSAYQNNEIRTIVKQILTLKEKGYAKDIDIIALLERLELIFNTIAIKQSIQNRRSASISKLDSLSERNMNLRSQLVKARISANEVKIDSLEELVNGHERFLERQFPNKQFLDNINFSIKIVQKNLKQSEAILKYLFLTDALAVITITKDDFLWQLEPWGALEKNLLTQFNSALQQKEYKSEIGEQLAKALLPQRSLEKSSLIINPDGALAKLPFELLQIEGDYLLQKKQIHYTSNLIFNKDDYSKNNKTGKMTIYAPTYPKGDKELKTRSEPYYLEGAKAEAQNIAKMFPSIMFTASELPKDVFIETAPKAAVLHLAMHAIVNNTEPALSHLLFGDGTKFENNLYLEELSALNFKAQLVVLSACNTGIGKEDSSGGIASLQRAFVNAGAPATVASLWEVPDLTTQQIMEAFYMNLKKGLTKSEALQKAKQEYLQNTSNPKLKVPYYWAGFVLYGNDAPLNISLNNNYNVWWMVFGGLCLLVLVVCYIKRLGFSKP